MPVSAINNYNNKISNYGGAHQIWFEAEDYDERNPDTDKYYPVVDVNDAFAQAISRGGGAGGMIRWTFDISAANGKRGTWYFWARILNPAGRSDFMLVEGHPDDAEIPTGPPFPGGSDEGPFANDDDRIFEQSVPAWGWWGNEEGSDKVLQDGENTMYIFHRQGNSTVFWDVFMWTDSPNYVPTDEDYQNATVAPLGRAFNPSPANGVIYADTWVSLSWRAGDYAISHDVYFGDSFDDVDSGTGGTFRGNQTSNHFIVGQPGFPYPEGLVPGTTYYWRVDEFDGAVTHRGNVWNFFTTLAFTDIAPGGAGMFSSIARSESDPNLLFFGTDVGGVLRSTDGGASFQRVMKGVTTTQIQVIEILDRPSGGHTVYMGTASGLFQSDDLGENWQLTMDGVEIRTSGQWLHPVSDIAIDPYNPQVMWISIGESISPKYRLDPYHIYKSTDGGYSWTGVFTIPMPEEGEPGSQFQQPLWAKIKIDPTNSNTLYFPTNWGLYATYDGGSNWYELGRDITYHSADGGLSWQDCRTAGTCLEWMTHTCSGSDCLPITDYVDHAIHPNLRDLDIYQDPEGGLILYAVINDRGHMDDNTCTRVWDTGLTRLTSGPYRSLDGGLTWEYLFKADGSVPRKLLSFRCNENVTRVWDGITTYQSIKVDPEDPEHFFLASAYYVSDISEYTHGTWQMLTRDGNICPGFGCIESAPWLPISVFDFDVDWSGDHPTLYYSSFRDVTRADYSEPEQRFLFDPYGTDPVPGNPGFWTSTGNNDYCSMDLVAVDDDELYAAGEDKGFMRSYDGGASWAFGNGGVGTDDRSDAVLYDPDSGALYASRIKGSHANVMVSTDKGVNWTTIGGYRGADRSEGDNGLPADLQVVDLAIDWSSPAQARRILAATRIGVYIYDPAAAGDSWARLNDRSCPSTNRQVNMIFTSTEFPDYAIVPFRDASFRPSHGVVSSPQTGVYLLNLQTNTCRNLVGGTEVRAPAHVTLARLADGSPSLVASGEYMWKPVIYQTSFDFSNLESIDWQITANQSLLAEGEPEVGNDEQFNNRSFSSLAVNPVDPSVIVAGMKASPYFDGHVAQHLFVSHDGGKTFGVAHELDGLPVKNISYLKFSNYGRWLYAAPACSGIYKTANPYL
ncbi:MAG: hypothetical protein ACYS0H_06580 [Planctomycetota bacterium]